MQAGEQAARNGEHVGISPEFSNPAAPASLRGSDRDRLFEKLKKYAPETLAGEAAKHTQCAWQKVFDRLWKFQGRVLRKAILQGNNKY